MSEIALERAEQIAESVGDRIRPYCIRGPEIVGSIRRRFETGEEMYQWWTSRQLVES